MNRQEADKLMGKKYLFFGKQLTVKNVFGSEEENNQTVPMLDEDGNTVEISMSTFKDHCQPVVEQAVSRTSDAWFFTFLKNLENGYYDHNLEQNQIAAIKDIRTLYKEVNPYHGHMGLLEAKQLVAMARCYRSFTKKNSLGKQVMCEELNRMEASIKFIRGQLTDEQ